MPKNDLILAVRRRDIPNYIAHVGLYEMTDHGVTALLNSLPVWFGPRDLIETDETFVQLIPYVILMEGELVVRYRRASKIREGRLAGQRSIGFGGHVEVQDLHSNTNMRVERTVYNCASREVVEEVGESIDWISGGLGWVGFVHHDHDTVGRVHLGVVGIARGSDFDLQPEKDAITELEMARVSELEQDTELETWSRMVLPVLRGE